MEDSFRVRLDRAFGSLNPSSSSSSTAASSSSSSLTSLWCLTDEEIERRNSNKSKHDLLHQADTKSDASNFTDQTPLLSDKDLEADIQDLDDFVHDNDTDDDDDKANKTSRCLSAKPDDHSEEEWDIRSSIGLDCTLDYEEEEDEYDKVAVGKESTTVEVVEEERLYLKDENDYEVDMDYYEELPDTFKESIQRDPRANHTAAKLRLKEDAAAESSGGNQAPSPPPLNLKSILKRKENTQNRSADKRVRFHLQDDIKEEEEEELETITPVESSDSRVPDHVRNPSRYTHYTFDSVSEMDDESNKKALLEFLNQQQRTTTPDNNSSSPPAIDLLPKSVVFSSRKKQKESQSNTNDDEAGRKESCKRNRMAIGIAVKGLQENEIGDGDGVCAMDEDEPVPVGDGVGIGVSNLKRQARQYRTKEEIDE
ncbi:putative pre-mRNA-splicing factor ATP-dependent RNA helicase DHX16 [Impatiens glandulifera]|uniref:putative pre-mRNA-splicing factor ATP-dependent RNA helicase DHX16 n=1 Tax=Impatiens glandulifera TaxID=253017 RepID=UPI001FB167B6|nr:putative pre-mRNA-splicing factor ATP-dependent RNA helicase DHX16 [Impatiens glandulifera]